MERLLSFLGEHWLIVFGLFMYALGGVCGYVMAKSEDRRKNGH